MFSICIDCSRPGRAPAEDVCELVMPTAPQIMINLRSIIFDCHANVSESLVRSRGLISGKG